VLVITAVLFYLLAKNDPVQTERKKTGAKPASAGDQLAPLKDIQVWRFATYYFFVFGGFVALASFLPRYYVGAYGLPLTTAGVFAGFYSLPGSVFRALGGWMSDRWGARAVMYLTFLVSLVLLFIMSYPETGYTVAGIHGPITFTFGLSATMFMVMTVLLGFMMSLGKAAVFKHIPVYYPHHVGAVGGLVGMIGGLGGFFLPISFGFLLDLTGVWTAPFMLLFVLVLVSTIWMHVAIRRMERARHPGLADEKYLSDVPDTPLSKSRSSAGNATPAMAHTK
jgi:NNP family nitrate/nitrite transporter-like MFS transporter